jgi:hypothetical protein
MAARLFKQDMGARRVVCDMANGRAALPGSGRFGRVLAVGMRIG